MKSGSLLKSSANRKVENRYVAGRSTGGKDWLPDTDGGLLEVVQEDTVPRYGDHVCLQAMIVSYAQ